MIPHPNVNLSDFSDNNPKFLVKDFTPRPRDYGGHAIVKAKDKRRKEVAKTQLHLEGFIPNGQTDPADVQEVFGKINADTEVIGSSDKTKS